MKLIELAPLLPEAIFDIRYDTPNNVTGQDLYFGLNPPRLDEPTAHKVAAAHEHAMSKGLIIVVFDAFRTQYAHEKLIEACPDPEYVDPDSPHLSGHSIDMTLADRETRRYLDMGTDYDDFSEKAHANAKGLARLVYDDRLLLKNMMAMFGMIHRDSEWWDFRDKDFVKV